MDRVLVVVGSAVVLDGGCEIGDVSVVVIDVVVCVEDVVVVDLMVGAVVNLGIDVLVFVEGDVLGIVVVVVGVVFVVGTDVGIILVLVFGITLGNTKGQKYALSVKQ